MKVLQGSGLWHAYAEVDCCSVGEVVAVSADCEQVRLAMPDLGGRIRTLSKVQSLSVRQRSSRQADRTGLSYETRSTENTEGGALGAEGVRLGLRSWRRQRLSCQFCSPAPPAIP
jgi:hypothetical protein